MTAISIVWNDLLTDKKLEYLQEIDKFNPYSLIDKSMKKISDRIGKNKRSILVVPLFIVLGIYFLPFHSFAKNKTCRITVKVSGSNECRENVMVELKGSLDKAKKTNNRGRVKFKNLPKGTYTLSVQKQSISFSQETQEISFKGKKRKKRVKIDATSTTEEMPQIISHPDDLSQGIECPQKMYVYTSTVYPILHYPGDYMHDNAHME